MFIYMCYYIFIYLRKVLSKMFKACGVLYVKGVLMWQNLHLCEHSALLNLRCPLTHTHTHIHTDAYKNTHSLVRGGMAAGEEAGRQRLKGLCV